MWNCKDANYTLNKLHLDEKHAKRRKKIGYYKTNKAKIDKLAGTAAQDGHCIPPLHRHW